jgi:Yip1 domain
MGRGATGGVLDIVQRAKAMILTPATEWRAIEPESGDTGYLFVNYVAILAAITPVCEFLRRAVFGFRGSGFGFHHVHHGLFSSLFGALVHYLFAFVLVYALAIIIDGLAPTFSAQKSQQNATKLVVYSMTPAWLAGVFALIPGLGFVRLFALVYGLYVFWLGLPILMKSPPDRTTPYAFASIVCGIVLWFGISAIVRPA